MIRLVFAHPIKVVSHAAANRNNINKKQKRNTSNSQMVHSKTPWAKRVAKERFKKKFLSKMQAQRLLQIDSMAFRRMCILKGIYPRSILRSRQKDSGNTKQYYLTREIKWLVHDDVRARLAAFEAWNKKVRRAKAQHRFDTLKALHDAKSKPAYRLDATIKERYPTFLDALRDSDDAMTMISLYAALSPEVNSNSTIELHQALPSGLHERARAVVADWMSYVSQSHSLSKSFISIKGFYHEAVVAGERIVWLMPHEYACKFPSGVQQYILISFLEFYVELMRFVLFKLRKDLDKEIAARHRDEDDAIAANADSFDPLVDVGAGAARVGRAEVAKQKFAGLWRSARLRVSQLFKGFVFYVSREVPLKQCRLIIEMCGGTVSETFTKKVTHFVVDRPTLPPGYVRKSDVEYVQPQYLFDCLNSRVVLPANGYRMGEDLPAHVSPFSVALSCDPFDVAELEEVKRDHPRILSYVPQRVHEIRRIRDPLYVASDAMGKPLGADAAQQLAQRNGGGGGAAADDDEEEDAARIALAPSMGPGDVQLDDADIAGLPRRPRWEDEGVAEQPTRSAVSALKELKQRELNQLNRPTSDAAAQRRADAVARQIERIKSEPEGKKLKRKLAASKKEASTRERMKLQVARKKAARYYNMIKGTQRNMEAKEQILANKAEQIRQGAATTSGQQFTSARESRLAARAQEALSSSNPKTRQRAQMAAQKKKAKADPYRSLPKWTR